jgi:hypothetical protein
MSMESFRNDDGEGTGLITVVQYRYTPVSVNVGTEFGTVESFEYSGGIGQGIGGPDPYSQNGIPLPYTDTQRP